MYKKLIKLLLSSKLALYSYFHTLRWKHAVHSLPASDVFHNPDTIFFNYYYEWTVRRLSVTGTNLGKRKHNELKGSEQNQG